MPKITALEAEGIANQFLSDHLPDRFLACRPHLDGGPGVWRLPVVLTYAVIGPVGEVGEVLVSTSSEEVLSHAPIDEMMTRACVLYEQHRDEIEAPIP